VQVSFNRPYARSGTARLLPIRGADGPLLERYGYDVTYTTQPRRDPRGAAAILNRGAYLSVGHDEYWPARAARLRGGARNAGARLLLRRQRAYWKVRLSDPGPTATRAWWTCYKLNPQKDPLAGPAATGRFRDDAIHRPERSWSARCTRAGCLGQTWKVAPRGARRSTRAPAFATATPFRARRLGVRPDDRARHALSVECWRGRPSSDAEGSPA